MKLFLSSKQLFSVSLVASWRGLAVIALLSGTAVAQAQTQPTFNCNAGTAYLFQKDATDAYELNLRTGNLTQKTFNGIGGAKLNAFGYNPNDNYMWGVVYGTNRIMRIGSDFSAQSFVVTNLPTGNYVVGDISKRGIMYLNVGGSASTGTIYVIDLGQVTPRMSAQDTPTPTLTSTTLSTTTAIVTDWAVSPIDNNLYAFDSNVGTNASATKPTLYRFLTADRKNSDGTTTTAGTREVLGQVTGGSPAISASNFGSAFMDSNGSFYGVMNASGAVYRVDNPQNLPVNGSPTAVYVSTPNAAPNASNTDGARCALSVVPLPVQLVSFAATTTPNRSVRLGWTTASELNNDHFEVQRSLDGRVFDVVGQVQGYGTSVQASTYSFTDIAPSGAATYYRLRQVDTDGSFNFSPVRVVTLAAGGSPVQLAVAPNPTSAAGLRVQVQYTGTAATPATLTVRNLLGQALLTQAVTLQPGANVLAPSAALTPGVYWVSVGGEEAPAAPGVRVLVTE